VIKPHDTIAFFVLISAASFVLADAGQGIVEDNGFKGGLIVHVGCENGKHTVQLRVNDSCLVHGLDTDARNVGKAREYIQSLGLYGKVSVSQFDGVHLPYIDNLVNLLVADSLGQVPVDEVMRVLAPLGVAVINGKTTVKPWPDDIDEWTHYLHDADNNAVADDLKVGPPRHMQWVSHPLWTRHHDRLASMSTVVTAKGRLFSIADEGPVYEPDLSAKWSLTARDAFNGLQLWRRTIPRWTSITRKFRRGPLQLQRLLVTDGDRVFTTLGLDQPVSVLDAATGDVLRTLKGTEHTEEILFCEGILLLQVGVEGSEQALAELKEDVPDDYKATKAVLAVNPATGKILWRYPTAQTAEIMPRSLTASNGCVFFQERGAAVCLDIQGGRESWRTQLFAAERPSKKKNDRTRIVGWTFDTLVVKGSVVLISDNMDLYALAADTGDPLWSGPASQPNGIIPSLDILVINGVVWTTPNLDEGRDLKTGEVVSSNNLSTELLTPGHHHRCYRNKGTSRYIIQGYRGLEFRDTQGDNHVRHNWIRGLCQYGIMPANGLSYIPPHSCGCYMEAKLFGFWSLAATQTALNDHDFTPGDELEKGPAYSDVKGPQSEAENSTDWPTYRHDAARSGVTPAALPDQLNPIWTAKLKGRLTAPVIGGGMVLVSSIDTHRVLAMDATDGHEKWSFTTGAPVDSPPTIRGNVALFGSADGNVYCVRLSDGTLAWRFRAAPMDRNTVALGHLESLWPVHGSVLVSDGTAYFTAGRSTYLDGGIFMYGLDPLTGTVKYKHRYESLPAVALKDESNDKNPAKGINEGKGNDYKTLYSPDKSDAFSMRGGNTSDVLVADQNSVYLRHDRFDKGLNKQEDREYHLFSTSRLLDDNEAHRSHWYYGRGDFSGLRIAYEWLTRNRGGYFQSPFGKLLIFDKTTAWSTVDKGKSTYDLVSTDISNISERVAKDFALGRRSEDSPGPVTLIATLPLHPRAMTKAGDNVLVGGYVADATIEYRNASPIVGTGLLLSILASTGDIENRIELPSSPVFDGMAAADGRLFVSMENGHLACLGNSSRPFAESKK
jgi:outer membrane protein assembly factor BamB